MKGLEPKVLSANVKVCLPCVISKGSEGESAIQDEWLENTRNDGMYVLTL